MEIKDFKVSGIYDSWKVKPPCELHVDPYCHVSCPYYSDCFLYADYD